MNLQALSKIADAENDKSFNTGLSGPVNKEILNSVMGQLSDGKWENTPGMEKYWKYADFKEEGGTLVLKYEPKSAFNSMNDQEIGKWFAARIKTLVKDEVSVWDRKDQTKLDYLGSSTQPVTVGDAYKAYDTLLGRKSRS